MTIQAWVAVATITCVLTGGMIHILRVCLRIEKYLWRLDAFEADFVQHERNCREDKTRLWTRIGDAETRITRLEPRGQHQ
jgi:hypothetical protein